MKKTLLALAVAAVATSASAATVYNQDGTTVDVGGRFDVVLGKFGDDQRTDLRNNESRINIKAQHDLGDGYKVSAYTRLRFDNGEVFTSDDDASRTNTFDNPTTNKLWLALEKDGFGRVSFGRQNTSGDDVSLNDNAYFLGGNNNLLTGGKKVVAFRSADFQLAEGQTLGFGVDYAFGESAKNKEYKTTKDEKPGLKNGYGASLFYAANLDGVALNLNAGYTVKNDDNADQYSNATGKQAKAWRVASQLGFAGAKFGAEYGETRNKNADANTSKKHFVLVGAEYQVLPESKLFAQWKRDDEKFANSDKRKLENTYIVGADYAFTKNVVTYVQYGRVSGKDTDAQGVVTKSKDNVYGAGLRVYF
ncbi:porin [Avibacterium avium]|uniref:porin n=1 Tax=Avibacterium avium TaxID=751 RepID=UPI003BF8D646